MRYRAKTKPTKARAVVWRTPCLLFCFMIHIGPPDAKHGDTSPKRFSTFTSLPATPLKATLSSIFVQPTIWPSNEVCLL